MDPDLSQECLKTCKTVLPTVQRALSYVRSKKNLLGVDGVKGLVDREEAPQLFILFQISLLQRRLFKAKVAKQI